jgi:hypothetical protein
MAIGHIENKEALTSSIEFFKVLKISAFKYPLLTNSSLHHFVNQLHFRNDDL